MSKIDKAIDAACRAFNGPSWNDFIEREKQNDRQQMRAALLVALAELREPGDEALSAGIHAADISAKTAATIFEAMIDTLRREMEGRDE